MRQILKWNLPHLSRPCLLYTSSVWDGFSLKWYEELFRDKSMFEALLNSIVLGLSSSLAAAVIGTLGAVGSYKAVSYTHLAIDGLCGSGKSTLGALLASVYDCNLFHADDFYLPKELRTPERYAAPGGNVHWERIRSEILEPLKTGKPFSYRKFDCSVLDLSLIHI